MDCPHCSAPLIIVEHAGIELDYCLECQGLWFDTEELNLLAEALEFAADFPDVLDLPKADTREKRRPCPRCRKKMDKATISEHEVLIDRCPRGHGMWFDAGELERVLEVRDSEVGGGGAQHVLRFLGGFVGERQRENGDGT